ncbi:MAG: hypothetical protein RLZZ226_1506 [Pseudomonadota bacterium]
MTSLITQSRLKRITVAAFTSLVSFGMACHAGADEATGLLSYGGLDINEASFMKDNGLKFGGWANAGITYNATSPGGGFNGPVTFGDRDSEFQLNQFYLYLQKAVNTEGGHWDLGFRADFMFGTDSVFTQAYGSPKGTWDLGILAQEGERFYDIAFPQVYAEIFAPIGNGITAKVGHFYTIIGNEVVTAPDNFFYSHAYTMQYGEPFTHTGVLLSYPVDPNWSVTGGAVTGSEFGGWDGAWDQGLGNWAGIGGVTWNTDDKKTSVAVTGTTGETSERDHNQWSMYSIVIKHDLMEGLHYTFQHDHGFADKAVGGQDATWYGLNNYLVYDINDQLGVGLRGEWFRDDDGFRVASPGRTLTYFPGANSYYAFTAGLNWKPMTWVSVRPNVRYDWNDGPPAFDNGGAATGYAATRKDQFLFSTDVVVSF